MGFFSLFFGPPTRNQFARTVMKVLREIGDRRVPTYNEAEFQLTFQADGESVSTMNLSNLYTECCNKPKNERADFIRQVCVGLVNPMDVPDDFEDAKPDLLPTIRVRSTQEEMRLDAEIRGDAWVALPSLPLSDHLEVCLVYDLPKTMQFVNQETLDKWGVSLYEAVEIARHNLAEREFPIGAIGEKLFFFVGGDAYDATRMLLLDAIRALPLAGRPVAMPVNRDSLMITGCDDVEGLGMMADLTEKKEGEPRPLCAIPHMLVDDEWVPWLPPSDHPHHERFRLFGIKHYYRDYAEQKKLNDKLHEKTGEDVFVATFSAVERDGSVLSYCVWTKDVPTWLPKTDYLMLYDRDQQRRSIVRWDRLQEIAGEQMSPLDCYPPRWFVEGFVTPDQIERMGVENWSE